MSVISPGAIGCSMGASAYRSVLSPSGRSFLPTTPFAISHAYPSFGGLFSPANNAVSGFTPPAALYSSPYPVGNLETSMTLHGFVPRMAGQGELEGPNREAERGSPGIRYNARRQNPPRWGNRTSYSNSQVGYHNAVDIDRIRAGLDVRTTVR